MSESARIAELEAELAVLKKQQQPNPPANTMDELDDDLIMSIDESQFMSSPPPPEHARKSGFGRHRRPGPEASPIRDFSWRASGREKATDARFSNR